MKKYLEFESFAHRIRHVIYREHFGYTLLKPKRALELVEEGKVLESRLYFVVTDADGMGCSEVNYRTAEEIGLIKYLKGV